MRPHLPALLTTAALLHTATWAPAAATPEPALTITMTDDTAETSEGTPLDYKITLTNPAAEERAADVELTLPVGAKATEVRDGGTAPEPWFAHWSLTIPANGTSTVSASFQAGAPRPDSKGYTATACTVRNYARLLCATDINQVPGAPDIHAVAGKASTEDGGPPVLIPIGVGVLVALGAGLLLHARTRSTP
ncbi:hypothetical protein [Actinokineospora bangkokensis]|uniref:DUF11 domain-containing protein n=1 Tax=Actinokineospora bangkokensis TaxID=1193682 RepID=A0A1Q9LJU7_9PSEU|nr:hypothetical protein [Actinokineospora bangkokensis]OLR92265.1 hypothetical protein BJP25_23410 [Actinokineospora bangkokensis]